MAHMISMKNVDGLVMDKEIAASASQESAKGLHVQMVLRSAGSRPVYVVQSRLGDKYFVLKTRSLKKAVNVYNTVETKVHK